jgi:anthranilate phosphoribosyltransferase
MASQHRCRRYRKKCRLYAFHFTLFTSRFNCMSIASYLREIGRGAQGARSLRLEQAHDLFAQVLDARVSALEIGAFVLAMRMKGESIDELLGFARALRQRLQPLASERPVIAIASYNGARRLPNLVPLLALLLARAGARVLVHGPLTEPGRVTTAQVFEALGMPPATSAQAAADAWAKHGCAFVPTALLSPALEQLLQVRRVVGVRNSGHTMAKLLDPVQGAPCLRVVSHTHPEFGLLMAAFAEREPAHMALLRGTEGEAVADARRTPRQQIWLAGVGQADLGCETEPGPLQALPQLPAIDAAATAAWIDAALQGRQPVPAPIAGQAERLLAALARIDPVGTPHGATTGPPSGGATAAAKSG